MIIEIGSASSETKGLTPTGLHLDTVTIQGVKTAGLRTNQVIPPN